MAVHIVVPARFESTRLPGKPLADLGGRPMIVRVMSQAHRVRADTVTAAVDDEAVLAAVQAAGYDATMTGKHHESGSDRVMEVVERNAWPSDDVVVNVQGDEPLFPPVVVDALVEMMLADAAVDMATVCEPIKLAEDLLNPNIVKVVRDEHGDAIYFSRAPIPFARDHMGHAGKLQPALPSLPVFRHVGIYAFRVGALRTFTQLTNSALERVERLEQLRWLEAGRSIRVIVASEPVPGGIDTPQDLARVQALMGQPGS